jgi:predicted AAA+ superfamily ATPase
VETYVAQNLASIVDAQWPEARLAYFNVQGRYEVDFVIEVGRDCLALEVKAATRWNERDLGGLQKFLETSSRCRAAILAHNGTEAVRLSDRLWALPLSLVLS